MKSTILLIILLFVMNCFVFGQDENKPIELGILNEKAIYLPMPTYPFGNVKGAGGVISVLVKIDLKTGKVIEANAIAGHPLFRKPAENAALSAKFDYSKDNFTADFGKGVLHYKIEDFIGFDRKLIVEKIIKLGIINDRAIDLQKPIYPKEAKDFCAKGEVKVEVLVDNKGNVIEAKAISGDELLHNSAVEAVKNTKFNLQANTKGIIVYNFDSIAPKCIDAGIVNKKAIFLAKPFINGRLVIEKETIINVKIVINENGIVISARTDKKMHPLITLGVEKAARNTKFSPTIHPNNIKISAILVYKFKPDGTIEF
jgi:TonB family protein